MKLDETQVAMRKAFRAHLLVNHGSSKGLMWGVIETLAKQFNLGYLECEYRLAQIPSIGELKGKEAIDPWLAKHFPQTSKVMFDSGDMVKALSVWSKEKRCKCAVRRRSLPEKKEMAELRRNNRKNSAIGELNANRGDRWEQTAWNKCK